MLPEDCASLLPWLCEQSEDVMSNLFAFCVAATVDGVSGNDRAHPVNVIYDLLDFDMAKYWKPTRTSYLSHVSKARIGEVVANAISNEAAAPLAAMKKDAAAEAAELRLADAGWVPEMMTNREKPYAYCVGNDDEQDEAA
jgi:ParB family transcriptional regulator, chromosome partitioning protein